MEIQFTLEDVARELPGKKYHFAVTMRRYPHWYTLRKEWTDDEAFKKIVQFIRDNGYIEYFWRKPFTMFNLGEYKYWTMGNPIEDTTLINRAKILPKRDYQAKPQKPEIYL
jgi:hypothetical protein